MKAARSSEKLEITKTFLTGFRTICSHRVVSCGKTSLHEVHTRISKSFWICLSLVTTSDSLCKAGQSLSVTQLLGLPASAGTNIQICLRLETRNDMKVYKIQAPIADSSVWFSDVMTSETLLEYIIFRI